LTSLACVTFLEMVVWVGYYAWEKGGLDFDWNQVARKSWVVGQGSGRHRGLDQHTKTTFVGISLNDSHNWTMWVGIIFLPAMCSKYFGRGCP
jgi:hypothetical protein